MGNVSHGLIAEEIGPLIRSMRAGAKLELSKITGMVACALACPCRVTFHDDRNGEKKDHEISFVPDGCTLLCPDCNEGLFLRLFDPAACFSDASHKIYVEMVFLLSCR